MILLILKILTLLLLEVCCITKILNLKESISENMVKRAGHTEDDLMKMIYKDGSTIMKVCKRDRVKYYFIDNKSQNN